MTRGHRPVAPRAVAAGLGWSRLVSAGRSGRAAPVPIGRRCDVLFWMGLAASAEACDGSTFWNLVVDDLRAERKAA